MSQFVSVRPVRGKEDLRAFLDVPFAIYADDPNWVAPLYAERLEHLERAALVLGLLEHVPVDGDLGRGRDHGEDGLVAPGAFAHRGAR